MGTYTKQVDEHCNYQSQKICEIRFILQYATHDYQNTIISKCNFVHKNRESRVAALSGGYIQIYKYRKEVERKAY